MNRDEMREQMRPCKACGRPCDGDVCDQYCADAAEAEAHRDDACFPREPMPGTKQAFVVRWQSPSMSAPAFWYFSSKAWADDEAAQLRKRGTAATVEETTVSENFELEDEDNHA